MVFLNSLSQGFLLLPKLNQHRRRSPIQLSRQLRRFQCIDFQLLQKPILAIVKLQVHVSHELLEAIDFIFKFIDLDLD